jgi:hypothetical protein
MTSAFQKMTSAFQKRTSFVVNHQKVVRSYLLLKFYFGIWSIFVKIITVKAVVISHEWLF